MPRDPEPTGPTVIARRDDGAVVLSTGSVLSSREVEVLELLARGLRNREIAGRLYLTVHTVEYHATHIYEKLQVGTRTEAAARAQALGIVSGPGASGGPGQGAAAVAAPNASSLPAARPWYRRPEAVVVPIVALAAAAAAVLFPGGPEPPGPAGPGPDPVAAEGTVVRETGYPDCYDYRVKPLNDGRYLIECLAGGSDHPAPPLDAGP